MKPLLATLLLSTLALAFVTPARADGNHPAHRCFGLNTAGSTSDIQRTAALGTFNTATALRYVICPIEGIPNDIVRVKYRDRKTGTTASDSTFCQIDHTDTDGDVFIGATRYSCATPGGCATIPSTSYVSPVGTATVLDVPVAPGVPYTQTAVNLVCGIPGASGSSFSALIGYVDLI